MDVPRECADTSPRDIDERRRRSDSERALVKPGNSATARIWNRVTPSTDSELDASRQRFRVTPTISHNRVATVRNIRGRRDGQDRRLNLSKVHAPRKRSAKLHVINAALG